MNRHQQHTSLQGELTIRKLPAKAAVSNPRVLDYLRILNCNHVKAVRFSPGNHLRLYTLLYTNSLRRLALTIAFCGLFLPQTRSLQFGGVGAATRGDSAVGSEPGASIDITNRHDGAPTPPER